MKNTKTQRHKDTEAQRSAESLLFGEIEVYFDIHCDGDFFAVSNGRLEFPLLNRVNGALRQTHVHRLHDF